LEVNHAPLPSVEYCKRLISAVYITLWVIVVVNTTAKCVEQFVFGSRFKILFRTGGLPGDFCLTCFLVLSIKQTMGETYY